MEEQRTVTGWHVVAFVGELVLWGCAAWAGWSLGAGGLRWVLAAACLVAIIGIWTVWVAPRATGRLRLTPRLALIGALGLAVAGLFALASHVTGAAVALVSAGAVVIAQWRDEA